MKSYSGIPYTTGKQAADDVKTQLVGFIKIPKWLLGLCLITVFYILFVCFSMYKIGDSTTQLYEYPYTVSRKAQEMKTALYGIRISLPSLLATPDITALCCICQPPSYSVVCYRCIESGFSIGILK